LRVIKAPTARKTKARLEVSPAAIPPEGAEVGVPVAEESVVSEPVRLAVLDARLLVRVAVEFEAPVTLEELEAVLVELDDAVADAEAEAPPISWN